MKYTSISAGLIACLLAACNTPVQSGTQDTIAIAASFYPLAHIAEQIGGEFVTVTQITPGGIEPHDYEPTPQDLAGLQSAKLFLFNGSGLDPWAEDVATPAEEKGIVVFEASDVMTLLPGEEHADEEEHEESAFDPHFWLDPLSMHTLVERVRDALISIDPAHADSYRHNAETYNETLSALDRRYREELASCTLRDVVTSHNAFTYLAKRYDLQMISVSGLSPEDEPSAKRMAQIADIAQEKGIDTIFFETLVSPKLAQTIAQEIGAKTAVLNPIEGISDEERTEGKTYVSLMEDNLRALRTALHCE